MKLFSFAAAVVMAALPAAAQTKPMQPKSQKELEALQAIQGAKTPDELMAAVDHLIADFKTDFKGWALDRAAEAAHQKRDSAKAQFYAQEALKFDAKDFQAMLLISGEIAQSTRDTDLDKDDKLSKAEKYAKDAIAAIASSAAPNAQITAAQWDDAKKDFTSQAHEDLGLIANSRKKSDVAVSEYKLAVDGAAHPEPSTMVRLAGALTDAKRPDEAIAVLDKVLAMPESNDVVKRVANAEKDRANKSKTAK